LIERRALIRSAPVTRFSSRWLTAILLSALVVTIVRAQVGDDDDRKRAAFLKSQQNHSESSDSTDESPTPRPEKPKPKAQKSPSPHSRPSPSPGGKDHKKPSAAPKKSAQPSKSPSPHGKSVKKPKPSAKGKEEEESPPERTAAPTPAETPEPRMSLTPSRAIPLPTPVMTSPVAAAPPNETSSGDAAELTIEKSGYEKPHSFWYRVFHGNQSNARGVSSRFLTASVRAEIDRAPADRRNPPWQFIVVHNSGTRQGNARVFDYYHRHVRHMQNGLAYHFVIGNGTSTGNGQIEIGDRWRRQINGGHVHSDHLNNIALGICLVGDFNRSQPTAAQLQSCEELIRYLRQRCGKVGNQYMVVKPHREMNPPRWATDCPGDAFPYSWFRRFQ
jgi:outer membrane biosynthesis protein TonB